MKKLVLVCAVLNMTGCASMFTGTSSIVNVTSTPSGADCDIAGRGVHTPGNVSLSKSGDDLIANCQKEGYLPGSTRVESSFNAVTLLDTFLGIPGALAYIIDFSTGAAFEYPEQVSINLLKEPAKPVVFEEPKPITFAPTPVPAKEVEVVTIEYFKDKRGRCFINNEYGKKQRVDKSYCQ
jgi:hypothetical protein